MDVPTSSVPSTHKVEVTTVDAVEPHPNADRLEIVQVWGYRCVVGKGDFAPGDLVAYVVPDTLVPLDRPEFRFLAEESTKPGPAYHRVRTKKLRGVYSQGLLLAAPPNTHVGDDLASYYGTYRYEPPVHAPDNVDDDVAPPLFCPVYDVESFHRYPEVFRDGEHVVITEKIHGSNARYLWDGERFWVGSHRRWKKENNTNVWWRALEDTKGLKNILQTFPNYCFYGELYGSTQSLRYGVPPGRNELRVFDVWSAEAGAFLDSTQQHAAINPYVEFWVPWLYVGPYHSETVLDLAEGRSALPGAMHGREGVVVRSSRERVHPTVGRAVLKCVSNFYLSQKGDQP